MHRLTIAFVLMAAAALPRVWNQVSVRPESAPPEPSPAETPTTPPACCDSANHLARLLCLHRLALKKIESAPAMTRDRILRRRQ